MKQIFARRTFWLLAVSVIVITVALLMWDQYMHMDKSNKNKIVINPEKARSLGKPKQSELPIHVNIQKSRPRSQQEWFIWLRNEAKFRYTRDDMIGVGQFIVDEEPFAHLGFSRAATDRINTLVRSNANHVLQLIWMRAPDKMNDDGFQTTCEYEPYQNRENLQYMERMKEFRVQFAFDLEDSLGKEYYSGLGQNLTDAMVQILQEEPMARNFVQGRFVATFRDAMVDGHRKFQVTEKVLNAAGKTTWRNEFTSEEIPQPYRQVLAVSP